MGKKFNQLVFNKKHDGCGGGVPKEFKTKGAQSSGCVVIKPEHELCLFTHS